jgi:NAD(P)-dependent dehydrogenase (short-subunit alcohol dehydrogenase family)
MANQHVMQDPVTQYPAMDIPEQHQDEPGLDGKLQPLADHGERTYEGSGRLKGRKALITGADSGIGRAVAIAYAREGADLLLTYLPSEQPDMDDLMKTLASVEGKIITAPGNLGEELFCRKLVNRAVDELGGLDVLVNNAGRQLYVDTIEELETEQLESIFRTNLFSIFWLVKAALRHMPKGAVIINTTSIQAYQPSPGLLDYAATKAAIANFTKGLAQQLAPRGIRVNGVAPGPVWTPLQPSHGQPMEKLVEFGQNTPLGRAGQPAELAPAYVFLASQESSFISGEIIGVTGGRPL